MTEPKSPLYIRNYQLFWLARFMAVFSTISMVVLIGYQTYDIARADYGMSTARAAFQLGILGLVQFIPMFVLAPVAGLVADRFDRRRVVAISNLLDCAIAAVLAFLTWQEALNLPILFGLAAAHGAVRVFSGPAMSAIVPNIVPPRMLPNAIALSSIAWQSASVAGPAVGGLIFALSPAAPHALSAILLFLASILILALPVVRADHGETRQNPWRQVKEGLRFTLRNRFLLGCITLDLFAVLLGGVTALLPVFARDILEVGPEGLGIMRGAPALGAAIVALWLSFRPLENNVGVKMLWSVVIFGAATLAFGLSRNFMLSLALLVLLGASDMVSVFIRSTLIQLFTPDAMRGRVSSISGLAISASNELGEMRAGASAALIGTTGAVVFGGAGAIVITAIWAWLFPELRRVRTFTPPPDVAGHKDREHKA